MLPWKNSWFQIAFFAWIVSGALLVVDYAPKITVNSEWTKAFQRAPSQPSEAPAKPSPPSEQQSPLKQPAPARPAPSPSPEAPATKVPNASSTNTGSAELAQGQAAYSKQDYGHAFQWYSKASALSNGIAESRLGDLYEGGLGVEKDHAEAVKWYRKAVQDEIAACNTGDMDACADAGSAYLAGTGAAPDEAKGLSFLQKACDGGNVGMGCYNLGAHLNNKHDFKSALIVFTKGCNESAGHPSRDLRNFNDLIKAEQNCGLAFEYYTQGMEDIPKNAASALEIAKKGCLAANANCLDIGDLYRTNTGSLTKYGITATPDRTEAIAFYRRACAGIPVGGNDAIACLDLKQMNATDKGIAHDYAQALAIDRKQCGANGVGCGDLGIMYENGLGVPPDLNKAIELYTKACNGKAPDGCAALKRLGK